MSGKTRSVSARGIARRWWPVGIGAVAGIAVALVIVAHTPKVYAATTTLFVGSAVSSDSSVAYNLDLFSQQRALTYSKLAQSREIAAKVQQDLGESVDPNALLAKVSATPVLKTVLMNITATDSSPQRASDIANTFAAEFTQYVARLETPEGSDQPGTEVTVVQRAEPPSLPTSPGLLLNVLIGLAGGLILGFSIKWLIGILDRRVRTSGQIETATGVRVLGVLPRDTARQKRKLDLATDGNSAYAEAVRKLRTNLVYSDVDNPRRAIALISPRSTVSTTATATNLAIVLDKGGRRVALIDADLREPRLSRYLEGSRAGSATDSSGQSGIDSVLAGGANLEDAIERMPDSGIDVLIGQPSKTAGETLSSDALRKLFDDLKNNYDLVLCDTPGFLTVADAAEIGLACDGVVIIARQGKTRVDQLSETAETLRGVGATLIGAVLTDVR